MNQVDLSLLRLPLMRQPLTRMKLVRMALLLATLLLGGCTDTYPRDPEGTLERVRGGVMRVGVVNDPPFVLIDAEPRGRDADLARSFAHRLGARIAWNRSGHAVLMRELQGRRLDLVIGGHTQDSPWAERVSISRAYRAIDGAGRIVERVAALPPGENAWQMAFERHAASPTARRLLEDQ